MKKLKKRKYSEEGRKKLSEIMTKRWADKKFRKTRLKKLLKSKQTEEFKKKMSDEMNRRYATDKKYKKNIQKKLKKARKKNKTHKIIVKKRINNHHGVISMKDFLELQNG